MKKRSLLIVVILVLAGFIVPPNQAAANQQGDGHTIYLTLIPGYVDQTVRFDGRVELNSASTPPGLSGLPLVIEQEWVDVNQTWNILGTVDGGKLAFDREEGMYHLRFGPVILNPGDRLNFILPFVNLDYDRIEPQPDAPDTSDLISRQLAHRFSYRAGDAPREFQQIDIPFQPVTRQIDLALTPLMGESLVLERGNFRLSGRVRFEAITDFSEFGRFCQNTTSRLRYGDYRMANLLTALDNPTYSGFNGLNPVYQFKPTTVALRSELTTCQYDRDAGTGEVEALFSGRVFGLDQSRNPFPDALRTTDVADGNYAFSPSQLFRGVRGYEMRLGRILLGPGDVLQITVPQVQIQADSLQPPPNHIAHLDPGRAAAGMQLTYLGPAELELSLPYIPQTGLYGSQFPAILRPGTLVVEARLGPFLPLGRSPLTWILLAAGLGLLLVSLFRKVPPWLAIPAWLLLALSLFYGVRGSFGLLCLAVLLWLRTALQTAGSKENKGMIAWQLGRAGLAFFVIALAVSMDHYGTEWFSGLSTSALSPLSPLVLTGAVVALFLVLYPGKSRDLGRFRQPDLPVLILLLSVLCLYDAFDKSLLALIVLFLAGWYLSRRQVAVGEANFGKELRERFRLALQNRLVLFSIFILIIFALGKDLSSTYANEIQLSIAPYLAPVLIPLLAIVSVSISFISIALLFVLAYPYLPTTNGYLKATLFALFLFLVFLFGIGTDDRLIASLPSILVGRVIYYFSVPMLIGINFDINDYMLRENKRLAQEGEKGEGVNFLGAGKLYFKDLQGLVGTLTGILSLVAPSLYAYLASQPVFVTYFSLLEKLVLLPI